MLHFYSDPEKAYEDLFADVRAYSKSDTPAIKKMFTISDADSDVFEHYVFIFEFKSNKIIFNGTVRYTDSEGMLIKTTKYEAQTFNLTELNKFLERELV